MRMSEEVCWVLKMRPVEVSPNFKCFCGRRLDILNWICPQRCAHFLQRDVNNIHSVAHS